MIGDHRCVPGVWYRGGRPGSGGLHGNLRQFLEVTADHPLVDRRPRVRYRFFNRLGREGFGWMTEDGWRSWVVQRVEVEISVRERHAE